MATKTAALDEIPLPCEYGAAELKVFIRKNTFRGFIITLALLLLMMILFFTVAQIEKNANKIMTAPTTKMKLEELAPPPTDELSDLAPPPIQEMVNTGPAARAGNPIPVPDAQVAPDMRDFATMRDLARASSIGGDGINTEGMSANIDFNRRTEVRIEQREVEPAPDDFIPVESEPEIDMARLKKLVIYPDLAKRANVEGKVVLRVLVDKTGIVKKYIIESSDNQLLDKAAIEAIKNYGPIKPAIQNRQPVTVWVSIPLEFKLR